jgi:hypothetical protein
MDEKMSKEVKDMLVEELEKLVKQQSLVSWLRSWLWLMLLDRRNTAARTPPLFAQRIPLPRASLWARVWASLTRPFRAWRRYQYAKLDEKQRRKADDEWLVNTLHILRTGGQRFPAKHPGTHGFAIPISEDQDVMNSVPPCCRPDVYKVPLPLTGAVSGSHAFTSTEDLIQRIVQEASK